MIPVVKQPPPPDFSEQVEIPGSRFLKQIAKPTSKQWQGKEYWQRVLPEMRKAYKGICAYSASWIPHATGSHSIDHFHPKSQFPELAYVWDNYRYASARFNSRKGTHIIVDPCTLLPGWFILDFKTFFVKPNPELSSKQRQPLGETIELLKLNKDDDLVSERQAWYVEYCHQEIPFSHLQKKVPFIAFEIERQDLLIEKGRL
ncbi:MAG: hypothetical protein D3923_17410 [Candidatus Electrothrix sp. AR3]|nr:hypothetical protein [Candidatus Electrothrix sp. AR3]